MIVPWSVNLAALESRLNSAWRTLVWSACIVAEVVGARDDQRVGVLLDQRLDDRRRRRRTSWPTLERLQEQVHPAGLDLGEVQDVVDQPEQVLAGRVDLLEVREEASSSPRSSASSWSISE